MNRFIYIAIGATLGANARYLIGVWAGNRFGADFPYGTLIVNISGSFILGFLVTLVSERLQITPEVRLLLTVGFLGSFTTFSSFAVESLMLWQENSVWIAIRNIMLNNGVGLACALLGIFLARQIR